MNALLAYEAETTAHSSAKGRVQTLPMIDGKGKLEVKKFDRARLQGPIAAQSIRVGKIGTRGLHLQFWERRRQSGRVER